MYYVMSDIHGDYQSFQNMLKKIQFCDADDLYILGDIVDKGEDNLRLLDAVRAMERTHLIKGNHEYLFERYLQGTITAELWDACGGSSTRREADALNDREKKEYLAYLKGLPIYEIVTVDEKEYFLTHSGYHADFDIFDPKTGRIRIRDSVEQAAAANQERYLFSDDIHYLPAILRFDMRIIVGHYPTLLLEDYKRASIYYGKKYIDIDTGNERRKAGGRLACLRLNDRAEFYV